MVPMISARSSARLRLAFPVLLFAAAAMSAFAARVEPPLELLYAPENRLVAGTVVEINPTGRLVFERKQVLGSGSDVPDRIDVRVSAATLHDARLGGNYVFAYSMWHPDPLAPGGAATNREGAVLLSSTGIEPALFRDTPELRAILDIGRDEHGRESRELERRLVAALSGTDPQLQNLAAGEIALDRDLGERLTGKDRTAIAKFVRDPARPSALRARLLLAASERERQLGDWWRPAAVKIVASTPVDGYPRGTSGPVDLVLVALDVLDKHAVTVPAAALRRWLWSPNRLLVEQAVAALGRLSPASQHSAIRKALADPQLPGPNRKFLDDRLRRLDRLDAGSRAQNQGQG